jgi:hypothetical protein
LSPLADRLLGSAVRTASPPRRIDVLTRTAVTVKRQISVRITISCPRPFR